MLIRDASGDLINTMLPLLHILLLFISFTRAIINGTDSQPLTFTFVASLQWDHRHKCGGTLVDSETVLTVAHCHPLIFVNQSQPGRASVLLGTNYQLTPRGPYARRVGVRRVLFMESYRKLSSNHSLIVRDPKSLELDYLLVFLNESVEESPGISYAPIIEDGNPEKLTICYVLGWGRSQWPDVSDKYANIFPDRRQQGRMRILETATPYKNLLASYQVQSGLGGIPCFGDSGSPVMCPPSRYAKGPLYLAAMVEAGKLPCNFPKSGILLMSVFSQRDWVLKNMCCSKRGGGNGASANLFGISFPLLTVVYMHWHWITRD